ncbi:MAG: PAS domain S-box protein [Caldilineaceae bacterium]
MITDEQRFEKLIEHAPEAITLLGADGTLQYASRGAARMFGYGIDELVGVNPAMLTHPEDVERVIGLLQALVQEPGKVVTTEYRFRHKDGRWRWIESTISNLLAEPGINAILFNFHDITERVETEKMLRESEERFRIAFRTSPDAININRLADGMYVDVNDGFTQITGYAREDVVGRLSTDINIWHDPRDRDRLVSGLIAHGQVNNLEAQFRLKDGSVVRGLMSAKVILLDGEPHTLSVTRDVEERWRMEDARDSEELFRTAFRTSPDSIQIARLADGLIVDVNEGFTKLCGFTREETIGKSSNDIDIWHDAADRDQLVAGLAAHGEVHNLEAKFRMKNGRIVRSLMSAKIITLHGEPHILSISRDIERLKGMEDALSESNQRLEITLHELREAQSQIVQQERLAAVGQLAAGIAHDFNNILAVITLQAQMALSMPVLPQAIRGRIETITQQTRQAADLAQQMLDFGRRSVLHTRPINFVALLKEQVDLLAHSFPGNVDVRFIHDADEYVINADATRLKQMITNLALNARDAMPTGGALTFHLGLDQGNGSTVRLTAHDTGEGISEAALPHVFEPFFTTKEPGRGTGLGLAQVYGIVKQHGGSIEVHSQPTRGTTFVITLPLYAQQSPVQATTTCPANEPIGTGETVLVVEDDPALRQALVDMIEMLNYTPLAAADRHDTLAHLQSQDDEIVAILYDLGTHRTGDPELWQDMAQLGVTQPVVVLCNDRQQIKLWTNENIPVAEWLQKPVDPQVLADAIAKTVGHLPASS